MKRNVAVGLLVLGLLGCLSATHLSRPVLAQDEAPQQTGWLEGWARYEDGKPIYWAADINVYRDGKQVAHAGADQTTAGLYSIRDLKPGVYEVKISNVLDGHRPKRIWGLVIKPGVRSILNITIHDGKDIEEVGKPDVATEKILIISQELDRLQKQIDELKAK